MRTTLIVGALAALAILVCVSGCCSSTSSQSPPVGTSAPIDTIAPAASAPVATLSRMSTTPTTKEPTHQGPELELTILDHDWERQGAEYLNAVYVVGTAKNTGAKTISSGFIDVKWFDAAGNVIGGSVGSVDNLKPGETFKYRIIYLGGSKYSDVVRYEVSPGKLYNYD